MIAGGGVMEFTGGRFMEFTVETEDDEDEIAENSISGAEGVWYNIWDGVAEAFRFVLFWKRLLPVLLNEKLSATFCGAKRVLDKAGTVDEIVFGIIVCSLTFLIDLLHMEIFEVSSSNQWMDYTKIFLLLFQ